MRDMSVCDDRIGFLNRLVAASVALVCFVSMLIWSVPGVDPSVWNELAVVSGLRPPQTVFPGFWRFLAGCAFPLFGSHALRMLNLAGAAVGAVCVYSFCLIVRQILSFLIRFGRPYPFWHLFIAPFFMAVAGLCFGLSDPLWSITRTFSPEEIRLFMFLGIVHGSIRWFVAGGNWRLFPVVTLMGAMSAETSFACLFPPLFVAAYVAVWHCVMDGLFQKPEKLPEPSELPKWRMFFLFLGGLALAACLNVRSFMAFGGLEASGWSPAEVYFRYAAGYWHVFIDAATLVGWMLGLCFCVLPFVVALRIAPLVIRDDRPMQFNLGVMMFFIGVLSILQMGAFASGRFWTFAKGTTLVGSGFLLVFFLFCSMAALAITGAAFAFECHRTYQTDEDGARPGFALKASVPVLFVVLVVLVYWHVPKPVETEMQRVVDAGVAEIVTECGDAKWIFTDGHLDAAIELESARRGGSLRCLNMMSGSEPWDVYLRRRYFKPETDDWRAAETGVPVLLRTWAGEKKDGLKDAALQLGFEYWKRDRKALPKSSGMVARESGMSDEERDAGIERSKLLSQRLMKVAPSVGHASSSPALSEAFSAVNWRLSRFARLRDDVETANALDNLNGTLREMLDLFEQERLRTFMQMTPAEGLQIALRRADFVEARRFATVVLNYDEENPAANFAMGMGAIRMNRMDEAERYLRTCLKKRPRDPAVINNLSIVCRKQGKYKEAEAFARRAVELLPDYPEVKQTLNDALRKAP